MNYHKLAFTPYIKGIQELYGSRNTYSLFEKNNEINGLSANEINFIQNMNHFFLASIGANDYPYIQHRGGKTEFVKVLDSKKLGFVDFSGNKQYISVGNITSKPNVSAIFLSYPHKARLKIYAKAEIIALKDNLDLLEILKIEEYKYRPERMIVLNIQAFDWNCPQHIMQRYTTTEIENYLTPYIEHINNLENEIERLKKTIANNVYKK